jgi:hypothetical protein
MYYLLEISILSTIWFRNCFDSVVFFVFHFILEHKIDHDLSRTPWLNSGLWRGVCCSSICLLLWLIFVFCFVPKFVYVVRFVRHMSHILFHIWGLWGSCFLIFIYFCSCLYFLVGREAWRYQRGNSDPRLGLVQRCVYLLIAPCSLLNGTKICLSADCPLLAFERHTDVSIWRL